MVTETDCFRKQKELIERITKHMEKNPRSQYLKDMLEFVQNMKLENFGVIQFMSRIDMNNKRLTILEQDLLIQSQKSIYS